MSLWMLSLGNNKFWLFQTLYACKFLLTTLASKGLFINDVMLFGVGLDPPSPYIIENHFLADSPSPPDHGKSLFAVPPHHPLVIWNNWYQQNTFYIFFLYPN